MPKLYFLTWLPASGKSTWAKEQVALNPHGTVRVNKDDLRAMCHNSVWGKDNEKLICKIRDDIILEAIDSGRNVIVDDTNFEPKHLESIKQVVSISHHPEQVTIEEKFFDVPFEECMVRDAKRGDKSVGAEVIKAMYDKYLKPIEEQQMVEFEQDPSLPDCVIVDIDGTVAKMNGRGPHEYHRVSEDLPQKDIIDLVHILHNSGNKIIFLSGRKPSCKNDTNNWLYKNYLYLRDSELYMREDENDNRKDFIFKEEAYNKYIKGKYYVKYVLDDRDQVVQLWRRLGLRCLQVANGDF